MLFLADSIKADCILRDGATGWCERRHFILVAIFSRPPWFHCKSPIFTWIQTRYSMPPEIATEEIGVDGTCTITTPKSEFAEHHTTFDGVEKIQAVVRI